MTLTTKQGQKELDVESGALTCAVLSFFLLPSSSAAISLLADEHHPTSTPLCLM